MSCRGVIILLLSLWLVVPGHAHASEDGDRCTAFIDAVPATIATPGTWCLRRDVAAKPASGSFAITITTDHVTLDCKGFRIFNRFVNFRSENIAIVAYNRSDIAIRDCGIEGFWMGINLAGGRRHAVERNRLAGNTYLAIYMRAERSVVQRNAIFDTGGSLGEGIALGIDAQGDIDILDNVVNGVSSPPFANGYSSSLGIFASGGAVGRNRIRNLTASGTGLATGILSLGGETGRGNVYDNELAEATGRSYGILCFGGLVLASGNIVNGFANPIDRFCKSFDNRVVP